MDNRAILRIVLVDGYVAFLRTTDQAAQEVVNDYFFSLFNMRKLSYVLSDYFLPLPSKKVFGLRGPGLDVEVFVRFNHRQGRILKLESQALIGNIDGFCGCFLEGNV